MARSRQAGAVKSNMVTLVYGAPFTGKTTLALQMAYLKRADGKPFRVLVIDGENGGVDEAIEELVDNGVHPDNVLVIYTQSLQEAEEIIRKVNNHEPFYEYDDEGNETDTVILDADGQQFYPDGLVVDGTSVFKMTTEQGLLELSKKRNTLKANKAELTGLERTVTIQNADLEFKDYKKLNFKGQNFVLNLMGCGIHVAITAREKDETEQIEVIENGKKTTKSVSTGRKVYDSFKGLDYNVKTIVRTFRNEDNAVCVEVVKDRTKVHEAGTIIEDPTLLDWQVLIDRGKNKKEFVLNNDLDGAVNTECKMWERDSLEPVEAEEKSEPVSGTETDTAALVADIMAKMKSLAPVNKSKAKEALTTKGLPATPTAIKAETNTDTLTCILNIVSEIG